MSEIASVLVDAVISLGKDNASRNWVMKVLFVVLPYVLFYVDQVIMITLQ